LATAASEHNCNSNEKKGEGERFAVHCAPRSELAMQLLRLMLTSKKLNVVFIGGVQRPVLKRRKDVIRLRWGSMVD
jgi:hypothetical protein